MDNYNLLTELYRTTAILDTYIDRYIVPEAGISRAQFSVLYVINRFPGTTKAEVARILHHSHVAIGRMVPILVKQGYVSEKPDEKNQHARLLYVTDSGTTVMTKVKQLFEDKAKLVLHDNNQPLDEVALTEQLKLLSERMLRSFKHIA